MGISRQSASFDGMSKLSLIAKLTAAEGKAGERRQGLRL
jgi:hypothetical protein